MLVSSKVLNSSGVLFGTSGARGLVEDFTPDVCAAFTAAFVGVMKKNHSFDKLALAIDCRPSSYSLALSCAKLLKSLGIEPIFYGVLPTPALAYKAMSDAMPCIMVTGSHIPFDRNGLKFYRPNGEITKTEEQEIMSSDFHFNSVLTTDDFELVSNKAAADDYITRYSRLFDNDILAGKRIGIYEHSSAGKDLYAKLFRSLGATEVISLERSDKFIPIDTEAVSEEDKSKARVWSEKYNLDAIFSTDGDGDRPLLADEKGEWLRGDILGLLSARALNIEALAMPINCNTAVELSGSFKEVYRTRIGSPYVIAEFEKMSQSFDKIAGFEANGGFLLGSDISLNGKTIKALPTRDAILPAMMVLAESKSKPISEIVQSLPSRVTYSDRIKKFETEKSRVIIKEAASNVNLFLSRLGFESIDVINISQIDGLRLTLSNGNIIHIRPSGNAPELRCYSESNSLHSAKECTNKVLRNIVNI